MTFSSHYYGKYKEGEIIMKMK